MAKRKAKRKFPKCKTVGKNRVCNFGGRTVVLHEGKSNHAAKVRRGKALHRAYSCKRSKATGQYTSCAEK